MANPWVAKYTKQMTAMMTPDAGGEIGAWAETRGVPHSQIMRELIEAGLAAKRREWTREFGALDPTLRAEHVLRCTRQGGRQTERRRDYDDNRRGRETRSDEPVGSASRDVDLALRRQALGSAGEVA